MDFFSFASIGAMEVYATRTTSAIENPGDVKKNPLSGCVSVRIPL